MAYSSSNDIAMMLKAIRVARQDLNVGLSQAETLLSHSNGLTPEQSIQLRSVLRDLKVTSGSVDELLYGCQLARV